MIVFQVPVPVDWLSEVEKSAMLCNVWHVGRIGGWW